jgi:hypothetical protein
VTQQVPLPGVTSTDYHEKSIFGAPLFLDDSLSDNLCDDNSVETSYPNHSTLNDPEEEAISNNMDTANPLQNCNEYTPTNIDALESFNVPAIHDDKLIIMIKLIQAVRQSGAPLNLVDKVIRIFKEEAQTGTIDFARLCTHRTALRKIGSLYPFLPLPKMERITHERTSQELKDGTERPVTSFPTFSFLAQLQDLLDDHIFSDTQNLVVNPNNRWHPYRPNSSPYATTELQDGQWFQRIVSHVVNNPLLTDEPEFIIGIQGYVDKTGTDAYNRTSVEPLVFTLTLFTNNVRNSSKYWRVLALLPSSLYHKQTKKHTFGASVRNYHIALTAAFQEFISLQKNPPIVRLRIGNEVQMVRARLFWVNTIADGLANEQLVGRIQNRMSSPRLSRACHCPQHLADNYRLHCRYLREKSVERLVVAGLGPSSTSDGWSNYLNSIEDQSLRKTAELALEVRKKIAKGILKNVFGQHLVDLVWFQIDQGPNPRGCFGSTSVDPMHAFEEGVVPYILSVILDPLSETAKSNIDYIALSIVSMNRWNSDYPRMNFSGGFCSLTQLTADEKMGKLLLLWVVLHTPLGQAVFDRRCSPSFDAKKASAAARFTTHVTGEEVENDANHSDMSSTPPSQRYTGSASQQSQVDIILTEHKLNFIFPWIREMSSYHAHVLRNTVYIINDTTRSRGTKGYTLPDGKFLDRREVFGDTSKIYCDDARNNDTHTEEQPIEYAGYSLDCNTDQLKVLVEMLLSFHATYKYGRSIHNEPNFAKNVRLMMRYITRWVKRGSDTKNWSISKFHELLHIVKDCDEFGSQSNVDAGKGEHGLKTWAKLPAKTVRPRQLEQFYHDLATRIYENRLLELASDTLLPIHKRTSTCLPVPQEVSTNQVGDTDETKTRIELNQVVTVLKVTGTTILGVEFENTIRAINDIVFPVTIYQEAHFFTPEKRIVRSCPQYRSSGPWRDWVYVQYENRIGNRVYYPYQVFGFFWLKDEPHAIGRMGLRKKSDTSKLIDVWVFESKMRLVDLQTVYTSPFVLIIPESCCVENGNNTPDRFIVFRDRIDEWPGIFLEDWPDPTKTTRAGKRRRGT